MVKENKSKEKLCLFFASDYHFEMISLPYINEKLKQNNCTIQINDFTLKEFRGLLSSTENMEVVAFKRNNPEIYQELLPYSKGARCTFPGWRCNAPCVFGAKKAIERKI